MPNSFGSKATLKVGDATYEIFKLSAVEGKHPTAARLPYAHKILLENLLRTENGVAVRPDDVEGFAKLDPRAIPEREIAFTPARVLLQELLSGGNEAEIGLRRDGSRSTLVRISLRNFSAAAFKASPDIKLASVVMGFPARRALV